MNVNVVLLVMLLRNGMEVNEAGMKLEEIAENHGLTPEGVDYALTQYQIVICEITHGMMSKLSYDAKDIISTAQERWCDTCDLKEREAVEPKVSEWLEDSDPGQEYGTTWACWKCMHSIHKPYIWNPYDSGYNYCPYCGAKMDGEVGCG